ncbi:NCS2 family permease [Virgibacillus sp. LDC1]|uniref:NCS2 family permease n=1 Tax=Paenibacillus TaxID=44249 RepID=UPI00256E6962|nr:NCS2 family permease [Paenibacillus lautus]MCV4229946.1 NCS2 family permease [Virgibacillus sp. LDC1]MDL1163758.1 NCS2 family permease [Yersinia pestis]MEC0255228.1 NCS2 family permease [Paenibacillus lautus]MEC0306383.1 NCS2 family permease [Paenibacillus lautus]
MFDLKANGTSVKTEVVAGATTFFTMAYVTVVNPLILSQAGVPFEQSFTATIIAAVIGTLLMGLVARYPIAVAPGMGLNAYFTYSVVQGHAGLGYIEAFSAVFIAGILFLVLSMTSLRRRLIEMIPSNLKHAITVGIGLFIAFIGLRMSGIITAHPDNLVALGDLHQPSVVLALVGLAVTLVLLSRDVKGALFIGMIITGIIAYFADMLSFTSGIMSVPTLPEGILVWNPITAASDVIRHGLYAVVFSFLLVTLFDTTGTVVGVAEQAGLMKDNKLPRAERAMFSDSVATVAGSMVGTSPTTAYVESAAGVGAGGRTGLTAVVVAALFVVAAFFSPLIGAVAGLSAITAPSLIVVGCLMLSNVQHIRWNDFDEAFPAFLVILTMPLTSSIATGIALGFISYPLMKIVKGKWKAVHPLMYIFAVLFVLQLVFVPH